MASRNIVGQKIATAPLKKPRPEYDFYTTPVEDIRRMLRCIFKGSNPELPVRVLDPCAGNGAFGKAIAAEFPGWKVTQMDIIQRREPLDAVASFLDGVMDGREFDVVMMNPPYYAAKEFIEHALENCIRPDGVVIAFLKLEFLESQQRYELFKRGLLKHIVINVNRVTCWPNDEKPSNGGSNGSGWFIFTKTPTAHPTLEWMVKDEQV